LQDGDADAGDDEAEDDGDDLDGRGVQALV